jgi:hypothetical protein
VGANFLNEKHSISVSHKDPQAVVVPADVDDDAVSGKKVRRPVAILDVLWAFPFGFLGFFEPCRQRRLRVRMLAIEFLDELAARDSHLLNGG